MENQHRRIAGYRELSSEEIDLMNRIKIKGAELLRLQMELGIRIATDGARKAEAADRSKRMAEDLSSDECLEFQRWSAAEPARWAAIAKTDIEKGIMALVRAVAQPASL